MNRLGQVFLRNRRILEYISKHVDGDILEIGGGDGRLTEFLVNRGKVWVVEIDRKFESRLREITENVIIGDFLEIQPFRVDSIVGNVPYYISSEILFRLLDWDFQRAVLMFQKEFAEKMLMKPRERKYGRLSVMAQYYFEIKFMREVSRYEFTPVPEVDSAIVMIRKIRHRDLGFEEFIRKLFSQKNKKLKNIIQVESKYSDMRPDWMGVDDLLELYRSISSYSGHH
ncbi:MAG: 16S rRNA (adenine(1518)-N(6)/adenine(1519)-N(6))-dimethyltransferase RsmA [Candidatus Micrarchaeota archaeon]|nr:16S rRNA (adenine(1518)-N(6)/adenine(1519)-N(6))-dimethyltransferase RsmA [Candidatus Micrarchaeota archaeon]MCX8154813.1 16S rRNA (adenine(1518)-N(6)/adenine(1519)-N(6))-dimethyltransferase RsmA [Candidatus Micrarchaeota archaeon]